MRSLLVVLIPLITASPQFPGGRPGGPMGPGAGMGPPPLPKELPPGLEAVLPSDIVTQLKAIHQSDSLSNEEKHEQIDQIMVGLPEDVADRLPKPPGFDKLPQDVKDKLKAIHRDQEVKEKLEKIQLDTSLGHKERFYKIKEVLDALPAEIRSKLPPPPPEPNFKI